MIVDHVLVGCQSNWAAERTDGLTERHGGHAAVSAWG